MSGFSASVAVDPSSTALTRVGVLGIAWRMPSQEQHYDLVDLKGLTPSAVRRAGGVPRLQWSRDGQTMETDFARFRPVGLSFSRSDISAITWRDFGDLPMNDPFFKVSLEKAEALPYGSDLFKTDLDILTALANRPDLLPFSGVIFHMARTGSTLIHRLMACTGKVQSLSEIGMLDRALQVTQNWDADQRARMMRDIVGGFRLPRRPSERHFVTKMTDSGASIRLPHFRSAFPHVPWIFVYRDPVEVIVSLLRKPTGNIDGWYKNRAAAARRLGMPAVRDPAMWPAEFVARTLERFCQAAVETARMTPQGLFLAVHYSRLPQAIWETIGPHFGVEFTSEEIDLMRAEARFSSKKTDASEFRPDSDSKLEEATPAMKRLAERFVGPVIEDLKRLPQA